MIEKKIVPMDNSNTIKSILAQISNLDFEARLQLMELMKLQIRTANKKLGSSNTKLIDLHQLGSDVWRDIDVDEYIHQQRQWD